MRHARLGFGLTYRAEAYLKPLKVLGRCPIVISVTHRYLSSIITNHATRDEIAIMVLLTITPKISHALDLLRSYDKALDLSSDPCLDDPAIGGPISHLQVIAISKSVQQCCQFPGHKDEDRSTPLRLDDLLRGSKIHVEPPKPKNEPVAVPFISMSTITKSFRLRSTRLLWLDYAARKRIEHTSV